MRPKQDRKNESKETDESALRRRILGAAFTAFTELGYSRTSTLEIATRARVSKRELYALVGNKESMLIECIRDRSERFPLPADLPEAKDREMLTAALTRFAERFLREVTDPSVIETFRLAIAEAVTAPEVARALEEFGRERGRSVVRDALSKARADHLVSGDPEEMTRRFFALLWGDLLLNMLLRTVGRPDEAEIARRSAEAARAMLMLYPAPKRPRKEPPTAR
ncbi:TetR/AcrR family transcriptional regulator [Anaeromyxobacter oryzae]|uniref:HTH tetR-type domain-containing protein n=1 Tax=Anaeromyxobacter oryzae TaxID=2918170 RepID=A0ABN6MZQ8_9BACT|nr:TetR/AcrR family transcriptional regulator [Anaeromyxobacter oryzae]BDG05038.1 hypothetical protein AMOR_40340 [Anaeromyxobacter oryzae]